MSGQHPFIAGAFLVVVFSSAGLVGEAGLRRGREQARAARLEELDGRVLEAIKLGRTGQFAKARDILLEVVAEAPASSNAHFNLAVAHLGLGDKEHAKISLERARALDPMDWDAAVELAALELEQGNEDRALSLLESVPLGEGGMAQGTLLQSRWKPLRENQRTKTLFEKHLVQLPEDE
ncbi:MAG: tetratricopeptide repeat protein [Deltaproteobacteria bacterium]|nr:tetratricopeptide repeat protein [Deltaproteobacteria bacterium]